MIEMISLRTFTLSTTKGHCVRFEANVPKPVPEIIVQDAMNAGCVPAKESDRPFVDDMRTARVEFVGNMRRSLIYLAVDVLARENNQKNFDGGGRPKVSVLNERLGFDVPAQERTNIWQEYLSAKAAGAEPGLHPEAETVMEIISAEDLTELRHIAMQSGVELAEGLSTRDARKTLLAKFSGIAADA